MTNAGFLKRTALCGLLCVFVFVSAATGIGWLFRLWQFPETNIVVVYILSVVVTARCTEGYIWGVLSAILSTCAFNAFFTEPYFTLSVDDPNAAAAFSTDANVAPPQGAAYFRVSAKGSGANLIVTLDEEIV